MNGLSDHDAQLLIIKDLNLQVQNSRIHNIRNINKFPIQEFKIRLSYEFWAFAFGNNDNVGVDSLFNTLLNHYLFYTSFPFQKIIDGRNIKFWITAAIKIFCNCKREF